MILDPNDIEPHLIKNSILSVFIIGLFFADNKNTEELKDLENYDELFLKAINLYQNKYRKKVIYTKLFHYNDNY